MASVCAHYWPAGLARLTGASWLAVVARSAKLLRLLTQGEEDTDSISKEKFAAILADGSFGQVCIMYPHLS
jgi:hypothetical protein